MLSSDSELVHFDRLNVKELRKQTSSAKEDQTVNPPKEFSLHENSSKLKYSSKTAKTEKKQCC